MTDLPPPPPGYGAQPPASVVVDTNATVKKSRVGMIVGVLAVVALIAGFAVWFVMADSGDDYEPGPEALAVVAGLTEAEFTVAFTNDELKCIDEAFAGVDLADLEGAYDPFGGELSEDVTARTGTMLDDCLGEANRIELIVQSMTASDLGTEEQVACAATKYDALVADNGGYVKVANDEVDISDATLNAFEECGIDLFGGADPACESERRTVDTAIEAYYANNGVDATNIDDLVPDYLLEDPSARFEFVPGTNGGTPEFVGVGECEGY